jgi:hypothetical protein
MHYSSAYVQIIDWVIFWCWVKFFTCHRFHNILPLHISIYRNRKTLFHFCSELFVGKHLIHKTTDMFLSFFFSLFFFLPFLSSFIFLVLIFLFVVDRQFWCWCSCVKQCQEFSLTLVVHMSPCRWDHQMSIVITFPLKYKCQANKKEININTWKLLMFFQKLHN